MKVKLLFVLAVFTLFNTAFAQTTYTTKSADFKLAGNSTMHKWNSKATKAIFSGNFDVKNGELVKINSATLKVAVKDIKSDKDSDMMDSRTHKSLKADQHPTISYDFTNAKSITKKGTDYVAVVEGKLTIAGTAKATSMTVTISPLANGDFRIKGSETVLFTNHGLKPPSFVAGTLKVDNQVEVTFDLVVKK